MLKKLLMITSVGLLCSAIVGCELNQPRLKDDTNCTRLQRQAVYNASNPNYEASWLTGSQHDSLKQQIQKNNCN